MRTVLTLDTESRVLGFRSNFEGNTVQENEVLFEGVVSQDILWTIFQAPESFIEDGVTLQKRQQLLDALSGPGIQAIIVQATQDRLDAFARTRNYDGILSAATYATSTVPKFAAEGQYAVEARDMTWATLYSILEEVQAGTRPVPTSFADVEPDLPQLTWPA